ncbi:MAG: hypothetical protein ABSB84_01120 [Verrucomicrobiota bacterium]|jgi:uncharacterized membrane protein YbhN (UPF0104 family)
MAFKPELEPNENLTLQIAFKASKNEVFNFAVSNRALYWPAIKAIVLKGDPTYFKRIRNDEISEVCIRRLPPHGLWLIAALMVLVGLATTILMLVPLVTQEPGEHRVSGWPFAITVGGILIPFAAKGRLCLEVRTQNKAFRWKPRLVVDKASKKKIRTTFESIANACEKSGLRVTRI